MNGRECTIQYPFYASGMVSPNKVSPNKTNTLSSGPTTPKSLHEMRAMEIMEDNDGTFYNDDAVSSSSSGFSEKSA